MELSISYKGADGKITYDKDPKGFKVEHPDKAVVNRIKKYLTKKREFRIPESDEIDDFRTDKALPTDNETYFDLALCTLFANTGVWVNW